MPEPSVQTYAELIADLPTSQHHVTLAELRGAVEANRRKVVVLDDDPTGCQTVHDVPIYTVWDVGSLIEALREPSCLFFIMINTRSLPEAEAVAINRQVVANLAQAAKSVQADLTIVSRSDSTLRGHYPAETDALREELEARLGWRVDGTLVIPFFAEGGRITVGDVHWVRKGEQVIPAASSEYARDPTFGYHHSDLREWVAEKTGGRMQAEEVLSLSLEDIRVGGPHRIAARLAELRGGRVGIVNAVIYEDMDIFVLGLLRAEAEGRRYLYRTGASFVRSRAAVEPRGLLTATELLPGATRPVPGLVLVGSFVERSTEQLQRLLQLPGVRAIELQVTLIIEDNSREAEIQRVTSTAAETLCRGEIPVVYTTRRLIVGEKGASLRVGQKVSSALVEIVRRLPVAPGWILAKGGITSHDIATKALGVQRALVAGQIAPGVPVWILGRGSRFPALPYVVFPGNVGQAETVAEVVQVLHRSKE